MTYRIRNELCSKRSIRPSEWNDVEMMCAVAALPILQMDHILTLQTPKFSASSCRGIFMGFRTHHYTTFAPLENANPFEFFDYLWLLKLDCNLKLGHTFTFTTISKWWWWCAIDVIHMAGPLSNGLNQALVAADKFIIANFRPKMIKNRTQ